MNRHSSLCSFTFTGLSLWQTMCLGAEWSSRLHTCWCLIDYATFYPHWTSQHSTIHCYASGFSKPKTSTTRVDLHCWSDVTLIDSRLSFQLNCLSWRNLWNESSNVVVDVWGDEEAVIRAANWLSQRTCSFQACVSTGHSYSRSIQLASSEGQPHRKVPLMFQPGTPIFRHRWPIYS